MIRKLCSIGFFCLLVLSGHAIENPATATTPFCDEQYNLGREAYQNSQWLEAAIYVYAYLVCVDRPLRTDLDEELNRVYNWSYSKASGSVSVGGKLFEAPPPYPIR